MKPISFMTYPPIPSGRAELMGQPANVVPPVYPGERTTDSSANHDMSQLPATGGHHYDNATPLSTLTRSSAPVDCPACSHRGMTNTSYKNGNTTRAWALGTLLVTWSLCCIPYCVSSTKDVVHKCGNCGVALATWHRSGHTEVHMYK